MSSKELQQPEVNLSIEANKHLSVAEKTLSSRLKSLVPEKALKIPRVLLQKSLVTAAVLLAIGNAGCNNVEQQNTPPPIPTPAVSELPTGMPSQNIQLVPTAETPASASVLEQQAPTPELSPHETVVQLRKETQAEYSKIMDNMEKDAQEIGYYFINIGGEGKDRVFLLPTPLKDFSKHGEDYILITPNGIRTFAPSPVVSESPGPDNDAYLKHFQDGLTTSIRVAAELGTKPSNIYQFKLSENIDPQGSYYFKPWDSIEFTDFEKRYTSTVANSDPLPNEQIKQLLQESKEMTQKFTDFYSGEQRQKLKDAQDLSNTLQSPSLPSQQPPTPPTQPPH